MSKAKTFVQCEECGNKFVLKSEDIKQRRIEPDLYHLGYECPSCNKQYIICKMNKEIVALKREIQYAKEIGDRVQLVFLQARFKAKLDAFNNK